jgi:hypothetical protein
LAQFLRENLSKKFKHWQYEQEHRLIVPARKTTELLFYPFSDSFRLCEVLIGARSNLSARGIRSLLRPYQERPDVSKMTISPLTFSMDRLPGRINA